MHRCRLEPQSGMKQHKPCRLHFVSSSKHKFLFKSGPYDFASKYKSGTKQLRKSERTSPPHCTGHSCLSPQSQYWGERGWQLTPPHCTGHSCLSPQSQYWGERGWHLPTVQATPVCHYKVLRGERMTPPHCTGHSCLSPQSQYWGERGWQLTPPHCTGHSCLSPQSIEGREDDTSPLYRPLLSPQSQYWGERGWHHPTVQATPVCHHEASIERWENDPPPPPTTQPHRVQATSICHHKANIEKRGEALPIKTKTVPATPICHHRPVLRGEGKPHQKQQLHRPLPSVTTGSMLRDEKKLSPKCTGHCHPSPCSQHWGVRIRSHHLTGHIHRSPQGQCWGVGVVGAVTPLAITTSHCMASVEGWESEATTPEATTTSHHTASVAGSESEATTTSHHTASVAGSESEATTTSHHTASVAGSESEATTTSHHTARAAGSESEATPHWLPPLVTTRPALRGQKSEATTPPATCPYHLLQPFRLWQWETTTSLHLQLY